MGCGFLNPHACNPVNLPGDPGNNINLNDGLGGITAGFVEEWDFLQGGIDAINGGGASAFVYAWQNIGYETTEAVFGLLGYVDKEVYTTQIATVSLIEDLPKDLLTLAVLKSIRENTDLISNIQPALLTGPSNSLNLYLSYGKEDYIYDLPEIVGAFREVDVIALDVVLTTVAGEAVTVTYSSLGFPLDVHWVKYYLQENEAYSEDDFYIYKSPDPIPWLYVNYTKELSGEFTVNLERTIVGAGTHDGVANAAVLVDSGEAWTINEWVGEIITNNTDGSTGTVVSNTATTITVSLTGGTDNDWDVGDAYTLARDETTTLDYLIPEVDYAVYYTALYTLDSDPTYELFWLYEESLGTHPTLDNNADRGRYGNADILPIIPLRRNFVSLQDQPATTKEYASSKALLDTINMDMDYLIEQIESNDDIASIEDAFFMFGVNLYSDTPESQRALYYIFSALFFNAKVTKVDFDAVGALDDAPSNIVTIKEEAYNIGLSYNYITSTSYQGAIGEIGTFEVEVVVVPNTLYDEDSETGEVLTKGQVNSYVLLRHQYDINHYNELKVFGLFQLVNILTTDARINVNLIELSNDETIRNNFIIPLPHSVFIGFSNHEQELLAFESMKLVIYASTQTHLDFYETAEFTSFISFVIIVIAIIYFVYSAGDASGTELLLLLAQAVLTQYALKRILNELLIRYGDNDTARLLIILAYLYASYVLSPGSGEMSSAETLLYGVNALVLGFTIELGYQAKDLQNEIDSWTVDAKERQEELDKARDLLDNTSGLEWWELVTYFPIDSYESPDDYYERTIHTANPGVLSLHQIENFHDNLLQLPELDTRSFDPVSVYE